MKLQKLLIAACFVLIKEASWGKEVRFDGSNVVQLAAGCASERQVVNVEIVGVENTSENHSDEQQKSIRIHDPALSGDAVVSIFFDRVLKAVPIDLNKDQGIDIIVWSSPNAYFERLSVFLFNCEENRYVFAGQVLGSSPRIQDLNGDGTKEITAYRSTDRVVVGNKAEVLRVPSVFEIENLKVLPADRKYRSLYAVIIRDSERLLKASLKELSCEDRVLVESLLGSVHASTGNITAMKGLVEKLQLEFDTIQSMDCKKRLGAVIAEVSRNLDKSQKGVK